ncbi:MAG: lysophospholipid acyltransferase family protein [Acidobacteriota bacterium]
MSRRKPPLRRRLRTRLLPPLLKALRAVFGRLSWRNAQRLGGLLGTIAWRVARRDRRRAIDHLAIAFPELPDARRTALARASFRHLATNVAEGLHALGRPPGAVCAHVDVEGFAVIERLRAAGRRIVILTGHCGNWELIPAVHHSHGFTISAIARALDDPQLDAVVVAMRTHLGTHNLPRGSRASSRDMLKALRAGGAVGLLMDQDIAGEGVWVPFFGRLAHTPLGAARLALRLGAAVVPTFTWRRTDGRHVVRFDPPLDLPDDAEGATAVMTAAIEQQIRRHPAQWVWLHRRWRRRPPSEASNDGASGEGVATAATTRAD